MQDELVALQGLAQRAFQLQLAPCGGLQFLAVAGELRLAGLLGAVQRQVGGLQRLLGSGVRRQRGDADAGADHQGLLAQVQRLVQGVEHALGDRLGIAAAGQVGEQHDELVAAEARQVVAGAQALLQAPADLHQHAVAGLVAEAVVDQLEAVEVDEQQRGLARTGLAELLQGLLQQLVQAQAVGQAGQRIVAGGVAQLLFHRLARADVALRAGHAPLAFVVALGDAAGQHPEIAAVLAAQAVFVVQLRGAAGQVGVDGLAQARQVVRMHA